MTCRRNWVTITKYVILFVIVQAFILLLTRKHPQTSNNIQGPIFQLPVQIQNPKAKTMKIQHGGLNTNVKVDLQMWSKKAVTVCSQQKSKFIGYNQQFAYMEHVVVDPSKFSGPKGGRNMSEVMNQEEEIEYLKYQPGAFQLNCSKLQDYNFEEELHMKTYYANTIISASQINKNVTHTVQGFTIAVTRYEYVNLYHTMTDYYNAFLMMAFLKKDPDKTTILLVDAHPSGSLDPPWGDLFHNFMRVSDLKGATLFPEMCWSLLGYHSPVYVTSPIKKLPLGEEFRSHFLSRYVAATDHILDCPQVNITLIWRRDYIAHPRNPTGLVWRKVKNEDDIVTHLRQLYPKFNITGVQMDILPMAKQVEIIAKTDILIGMHGAGLTMAMLLPLHATLIELFPHYVSSNLAHYKNIAKWRGLGYLSWVNTDPSNEFPNKYTKLPLNEIENLVKKSLSMMHC